jgi:hypothetical protein
MATEIRVTLSNSPGWKLKMLALPTRGRRGAGVDPFAAQLAEAGRLELVQTSELTRTTIPSGTARSGAFIGPAVVEAETPSDAMHVLMVRHASGAITFHLPTQSRAARRGSRKTIRFTVSTADRPDPGTRRGLITNAIRTFLFKVTGVVADLAMPALGRAWESAEWKGRREGWKRVTLLGLESQDLPVLTDFSAISSDPSKRNLLLLHGTFSNAAAAFKELASTRGSDGKPFFEAIAATYGERVFAFDHFTVSKSPEENVKELLNSLPNGPFVFDVITHSRGGLVLRHMVEMPASPLALGHRFVLRNAVLVASPNEGSPLASPKRFDYFLTWIANLIDLFPDNPLTEGVSFVSEGLAWLVHRVAGALPGLASMDPDGTEIKALQSPRSPERAAYSALVSNFEPDEGLLSRLADCGVDVFFGSANDLVVPTEGGWRVDSGARPFIPAQRIGCYGRGGNLPQPPQDPVSHISFFNRLETVDFLVHALRGESQPLKLVDPAADLPYLLRRRAALSAEAASGMSPTPTIALPPASPQPAVSPSAQSRPRPFTDEVFHLSILDIEGAGTDRSKTTHPDFAMIVASFRNARAIEMLQMRGDAAGQRFHRIITAHQKIRDYINGEPHANQLPHGDELIELGRDLFEAVFPGDVRRLYDVARAEQINRRINLVFTSQIAWLADLPWEFVYDPARKTFLATSEVNFTRNVVTAVPADRLDGGTGRLRILVVVAQPLGLAHLSVEQEKEVIESGFRRLIQAGLVSVEVMLDATPALLHQTLEMAEYDILHFIGHGEYDPEKDLGYLLFENETQGVQKVDSAVLQQIVCRRNIRLIFLNACETGEGGRSDFNRGVAPALVQAGLPAVVGNQYSVLDVSATAFARHLYWALAQGSTVGDAARESRVAVNYLISGEAIDWAVPTLFARDPAERFCAEAAAPEVQREEAAERQRTWRRSARGRTPVALWDVQKIIPHFDQIALTLTRAQDKFAFEAVSIVAPLGTWRREPKKRDKTKMAYLNVENVVDRLRDKPRELGVDRLIAFTNLPMRDSEELGLYSWDSDQKISLFSMYDFLDQLNPPALSIEKMVANAVVGLLSNLYPHPPKKGPADCPLFYNDDRAIGPVAGPLHFCNICARKLDPKLRDALERLLRVYP